MARETSAAIDPERSPAWIFTLYGATMLAVQGMENTVSMLYLVVNTKPERRSNASAKRQARATFHRLWNAFQKGTAGMKLNDAKGGIKSHIDADLYKRLDGFTTGPRAQLAHRFLIERIVSTDTEPRFVPGTAKYLLDATMEANALTALLTTRVTEILAEWPEHEQLTQEVRDYGTTMANLVMRKNYPLEVHEDLHRDPPPVRDPN